MMNRHGDESYNYPDSRHYGSITIINEESEEYFIPASSFYTEVLKNEDDTIPTAISTTSTLASESECLIWIISGSGRKSWMDLFFIRLLGFSRNPFESRPGIRNSSASDMRLAMLSNFSTAYNIMSISLVLSIMQNIYPATPRDKSLCSSALIAGMIVGQVVGGAIGDILGRHLAIALVMTLQVVGALVSSLAFEGHYSIYIFLAAWRFVLGLGCGGVYPLAATMTAESSDNQEDGAKAVALTFSMQGVGYLAVPLVAWTLLSIFPEDSDMAWRLLLGFGCIPGIGLMALRLHRQLVKSPASEDIVDAAKMRNSTIVASTREVPVSVIDAIQMEANLVRKILGTGGCWFLFDVLFYGNTLFQPVVLGAAFGESETVLKSAMDSSIISALALPGYFISIIAVGRQSPRFIQSQGFLVMGIMYAFIGLSFKSLAHEKFLLLGLYGSTFFFSNYGPNATTYMLPSMTFSRLCRSTLNGVCAAFGKAGALLGSLLFVTAAAKYGQEVIMLACSFISFVGMAISLMCVSEQVGQRNSTKQEQIAQKRLSQVPMKVVLSAPSFVDYFDNA